LFVRAHTQVPLKWLSGELNLGAVSATSRLLSAVGKALARAGSSRPAKIAMMAMTTSSSISVNPLEYERFVFILSVDERRIYPLGQARQALSHRLARRSLECGGKRSATPLLPHPIQSAVAASLSRSTPKKKRPGTMPG